MILTPRTVAILKNFATINKSISIYEGDVISTMEQTSIIFANAKTDQSFEKDFSIYELPKFINVLQLFPEANLTFHDRYLDISDGNQNIRYSYCDPMTIKAPKKGAKIKFPPTYVQFTLTSEMLSTVLKAAAVLGVPDIAITGDGDGLFLRAINAKNPTMDIYSMRVGDTKKTCNFVFKTDYIRLMPDTYNGTIGVRPQDDRIMCYLKSDLNEYWIAADVSSTFEKDL